MSRARLRQLLRVSLLILGALTAGATVQQEQCENLGKSEQSTEAELPRHAGACAMSRFDLEEISHGVESWFRRQGSCFATRTRVCSVKRAVPQIREQGVDSDRGRGFCNQ